MAKKRKANSETVAKDDGASASSVGKEEDEHKLRQNGNDERKAEDNRSESDDSSSDDESLVLEGVIMRNPDFSGSDSDDDDDEDGDVSSESEEEEVPPTQQKAGKANPKTKATTSKSKDGKKETSQKRPKKKSNEPETIQVDFLFCDMHERFFHGMKTLLHRNSIHAPHSSQLADLIIANEMVGTVLSSDVEPTGAADAAPPAIKKKSLSNKLNAAAAAALPPPDDANVFGFTSIVNVTTNHSSPTIQSLKALCLKHCPSQHKAEIEILLSGKTKRPAGFFFQERMVNVPLEIVEVLHSQLVLDMDHAVAHADDEAERKSLDFGAFVRLAPCYSSEGGGGGVIYKYFDDEVFATNAEMVFEMPKMNKEDEDDMRCSVIVMTKTGHRGAMKELKKMIHGN